MQMHNRLQTCQTGIAGTCLTASVVILSQPSSFTFSFFSEFMAEKGKDEMLCEQEEEEADFNFFLGAGKNPPEEKFLSDRTKANMIKYIKDKVAHHRDMKREEVQE